MVTFGSCWRELSKGLVMPEITLLQGDCSDLWDQIPWDKIDAVVTDPPYGIKGSESSKRKRGRAKYDNSFPDTEDYISGIIVPIVKRLIATVPRVVLTPGIRCMYLYPRPADIGCFWTPATTAYGPGGFQCFHPILYYGKDWSGGKNKKASGIQVTEHSSLPWFPCPKPIHAWTWLIEKASPPGATILDPFMGSGTTAIACIRTNRNFYGIELSQSYFEQAGERIEREQSQLRLELESEVPKIIQEQLFGERYEG